MDGVNYFKIFKCNFKNYTMACRPRARTQIVPPQDVLAKQAIHTRALFQTYLSEFRWRNFHRNDDKFNALMCCIADLLLYNLI
jgi:hypothetical protein